MDIRKIRVDDAEQFLKLSQRLDEETKFMLYEPGERLTTVKEQEERLQSSIQSGHSMVFVAETEGQIVGYLAALGSSLQREKHSAYVVVGILNSFVGQGIGTKLFGELDNWAREQKLHRLELTVMAHNDVAIRLYKKAGFEIEGIRKHSIKVDDEYVDELYMAKLPSLQ